MLSRISNIFIISIMLIAIGGVQKAAADDPEVIKALVRRHIEETWNKHNPDFHDKTAAPNIVWHRPSGDVIGIEAVKETAAGPLAVIPDIHTKIDDLIVEGDVDGLITEAWENFDDLNFLLQVGLLTLPEPPTEPTEEPEEDFSNVFFMSLSSGLNMVSLPLEPITPYTARSFAEELSATVVIQLDEKSQRFVGFTLDAPDDGFAIEGGGGYIVNVPESRVAAFTGAAWTNQPPVEAAPEVRDFGYPTETNGAWAFVVSGKFEDDSAKDGYRVIARNTRTGAVATDVVREGYFAAAFADLNRKNVIQTGDRLELQVSNQAGEIVSDTLSYTVTTEAIRQAFLPIILNNVEIPCQSLLLQNYPNPFNPETWIPYQIREPALVVVRIYSAQGRLVRRLNLGQRAAGFHLSRSSAAYWNGRNDSGEFVASGIYFYQLRAGDFSATRRMLIVK